jgi:hypothetical protein
MKFYCKNCGSQVTVGNMVPPEESPFESCGMLCPFCRENVGEMQSVPDYETPEQYEKRTGKPYPDNGPVWIRHPSWGRGTWELCRWKHVNIQEWLSENIAVIADPPVPPPAYWRP